jgi:hypothetical protein
MKFRVFSEMAEKTNNSIFISGGTRTGTTMMARLIYSLDQVECFHEPPFLYAFMYMINDLAEKQWKTLLEAFVFEELLLPALAGRRLNFNEHDDSCVYHSRPREEIAMRLLSTHRHHELFPRAQKYRLAFKTPEMVPQLDLLRRYYPKMTFLVMLRQPRSVIASLLERGWYSDRQLTQLGGDWLFRQTPLTDKKIAPWVPDDLIKEFLCSSEVERCAMCYIEQYRHLMGRTDCLVVDYGDLVHESHSYFGVIVDALGERFGPLTNGLLNTIREIPRDRPISVDEISLPRRRRMEEIYEACRRLALPAAFGSRQ